MCAHYILHGSHLNVEPKSEHSEDEDSTQPSSENLGSSWQFLKLIIDKCLVEDPSKRPKWSDIVYEIQNALIESYCDA